MVIVIVLLEVSREAASVGVAVSVVLRGFLVNDVYGLTFDWTTFASMFHINIF